MFHTSTANVFSLAQLGGYLYACGVFTNAGPRARELDRGGEEFLGDSPQDER